MICMVNRHAHFRTKIFFQDFVRHVHVLVRMYVSICVYICVYMSGIRVEAGVMPYIYT